MDEDDSTPWKEGFCPTCTVVNKIKNTYCKYDCAYERADEILSENRQRLNNMNSNYNPVKYSRKGWEEGFCWTCPSKLAFDYLEYCHPKYCKYKIFDEAAFKVWKEIDGKV